MPIDYEKEYDNRARVPEHVDIFARWHLDAEAYRAAWPKTQLDVAYGPSPRQFMDIFPANDDGAATPLALFIHGGWWRTLHPREFSHVAAGPNAHGVTVAVTGYELCPNVTIATIIEQMQSACLFLWRRYRKRIFVFGHSAGGHLAGCMLTTDWKKLDPTAPANLVPAAYSISGVFDLTPLVHIAPNQDLRLDTKEAERLSPVHWSIPAGRSFDAVVGGIESGEFLRQSHIIVDAWGKKGAVTRYDEIAGANHFTAVDPLSDPASAMTARVVQLARQVQAKPL